MEANCPCCIEIAFAFARGRQGIRRQTIYLHGVLVGHETGIGGDRRVKCQRGGGEIGSAWLGVTPPLMATVGGVSWLCRCLWAWSCGWFSLGGVPC